MFGRINLNIQIEIGLYDVNVSHVCSARFFFSVASCFYLVVSYFYLENKQKIYPKTISIHGRLFSRQTKQKTESEVNRYTTHSANKLFGCFIRVIAQHFPSFRFDFSNGEKRIKCLHAIMPGGGCSGNVVNVLPTKCLHLTISFDCSFLYRIACCDTCVLLLNARVIRINFNVLSVV